jgi:hypothetical protein
MEVVLPKALSGTFNSATAMLAVRETPPSTVSDEIDELK